MKNQNKKLQTEQKQKLLPEIEKRDLKVSVLPPNYMEKLKASVAGLTAELNKPGMRESIMAALERLNPENVKKTLLSKPGMNTFDTYTMNKVLEFLYDNNMDTLENFKKLEAINYAENYIEIGGVKRSKYYLHVENHNYTTMFVYKIGNVNVSYFKGDEDTIKDVKDILEKDNMRIPSFNDYEFSLKALPGEYKSMDPNKYIGGNILAILLGMCLSGYRDSRSGDLTFKGTMGYSRILGLGLGCYMFDHQGGMLASISNSHAWPIQPVFK